MKQLCAFLTGSGTDLFYNTQVDIDEITCFVNRLTLIAQTMRDFQGSVRQKVLKR